MKRSIIIAIAVLASSSIAGAQQNEYSLPKTTIRIEVEAEVEHFHAGPYAAFAKKLLGIDAVLEDYKACNITGVKLTPLIEADYSQRYSAPSSSILALASQGLVSLPSEDVRGGGASWRFPSSAPSDFASRGISSNFSRESKTLYKTDELGETIAVTQNMTVSKSLEKRAAEAADMVTKMRQTRIDVVTGNTDMTYSGQAMEAALLEMKSLEREYLSLFVGYSDKIVKTFVCEVAPDPSGEVQKYVAFRLSPSEGPVLSDDLSGTPVVLELIPDVLPQEPVKEKPIKGYSIIKYRIPAICTARLYDGTTLLLEDRLPIAQLGSIASMYVK